jgi:hypothetical protein
MLMEQAMEVGNLKEQNSKELRNKRKKTRIIKGNKN